MSHEVVEKNVTLLIILVILTISVGGLVEIVPLFFLEETTKPVDGVHKYSALRLEGRDVYIREGCYTCHSQMIRPFRAETERYGHYSVAGESVYDHPFQWGSKRTGPDLARVGGRYSNDWQYAHLMNPRDVVPESNMPSFPWLFDSKLDGANTAAKMKAMNVVVGATCPTCETYSEAEIAGAQAEVSGKTEAEALVAYLQELGTALK
ncbi:MAG: cytochrome-c oxidase, cbb3-type subunit II [Gammaproteobacteria bacterium]|nr:cytochrome-c oxidase, cbb3-type subunit II [Gammaproteobacteria bacterium]MBU1655650.1 cytochrome-c oxidase, cbb3-type subunit II [Gammaproteobacteria bacterium]MBU1960303.1 cytochrome-c oxidase, cbb3-type subunit II [Gammaproteobacteria bacterium]